jgi:DNA-binding NarL/FixJ family response regulator
VGIQVSSFIQTPIIRKWSNEITKNLLGLIDCQTFASFQLLIKKLTEQNHQKISDNIILLDIDNDLFQEYINQLTSYPLNFKLIACGYPKPSNDIKNLFKLGIKGFVDITNSELEFLKAVKEVSKDNFYLPVGAINELIVDFISEANKENSTVNGSAITGANINAHEGLLSNYNLSEKEKSVVRYLLIGYSYKQIAELIDVTPFAINQRAKSIYKKCGVKSRNELSYLLLN